MDSKSILASRTVAFNALSLVLAALSLAGYTIDVDDATKAKIAEIGVALAAVANVGLRLLTSQPVHVITPPSPPSTSSTSTGGK
jgi:hypothetical protein